MHPLYYIGTHLHNSINCNDTILHHTYTDKSWQDNFILNLIVFLSASVVVRLTSDSVDLYIGLPDWRLRRGTVRPLAVLHVVVAAEVNPRQFGRGRVTAVVTVMAASWCLRPKTTITPTLVESATDKLFIRELQKHRLFSGKCFDTWFPCHFHSKHITFLKHH